MPAAIYQPFLLQIGLWICLCLSFASAASQCYYPDAILQIRDTPCHPEAKHSNCCAPEDICLSNGLCYRSNINRLHRGSCTDPTFENPSCTTICTGPNDHPYGWADVLGCPLSSEWYCGWGNQSRCESGDTFALSDGYFDDNRNKTHQEQATITVIESAPSCTPEANGTNPVRGSLGVGVSTSTGAITQVTSEPFQGKASKETATISTVWWLCAIIVLGSSS